MLYKRIEWRKKQITQYIYLHTHKCSIHYKENLSSSPISTHAQDFFLLRQSKRKKMAAKGTAERHKGLPGYLMLRIITFVPQ